jgi:hypothetical protein
VSSKTVSKQDSLRGLAKARREPFGATHRMDRLAIGTHHEQGATTGFIASTRKTRNRAALITVYNESQPFAHNSDGCGRCGRCPKEGH